MTRQQHFDYYGGWLGPDAEKYAWDCVRSMDAKTRGVAGDHQLYHEFSECVTAIRNRHTTYANRPFTWDLERKLHATGRLPWELIPTHTQDTGNCVAAGLAGTGQKLQMLEIAFGGEEEKFRMWDVPWIYAVSRNQVGGGMWGAGSTGTWGARAVNEYGVLFADDEGVPPYSGRSDDWGSRGNVSNPDYQKFFDVAEDNKVEIVRATSVDQMTELMDAGYMLTEHKGLHVYRPSGSWSHQMHMTDMRRDPELMFYRMNQWGPSHATPLNGETPGGAWNFASDIDDELNSNVEVYGYCKFQGEPGDPDYNFV
jgi:hypothetical protein